jgi:transcriptional regulator with XRE-family HTH domain
MSIITEKIVLTVELASFVAVSSDAKNEIVNRIYSDVHEIGRKHEFLVGQVNWEDRSQVEVVHEALWEEVKQEKPKLVRATKNLSLGQYIREKRLVIGISQKALGKIMDLSEPCVSNWESGKAIPTYVNLSKIAKALGCPKEQLAKLWRKDRNNRKLLKVAKKDTTNDSNQQAQPAADIRERDTAADVQQGQQRDIRHGDSFATANSSITTTTF